MIDDNIVHDVMLERPLVETIPILPSALTYNHERMISIVPNIKEIAYSPNTGASYTTQNSTVKFLLSSTGYLDPYGLFIEFEIFNSSKYALQFDSSAHSLISKLVISTNGNILEEITDYDVINSCIFENTYNEATRILKPNECFAHGHSLHDKFDNEPVLFPSVERETQSKVNTIAKHISFNKQNITGGNHNPGGKFVAGDADVRPFGGQLYLAANYCLNSMYIRLPLMSFVFGHGLPIQNYKWIPLEFFPNFEVTIEFNKHAMFIPLKVPYNVDIPNADNMPIPIELKNFNQTDHRGYEIRHIKLVTTQLYFDSSIIMQIRNSAFKNGIVIDTQIWQSYQQLTVQSNLQGGLYVLNTPRKSIKSLITLFLSKVYEVCAFARKLRKYSRGVTEFSVKIGDEFYPPNSLKGNSGNTYGPNNNYSMFESYVKVFNKSFMQYNNSIVNPLNYAIDYYEIDNYYKGLSESNGEYSAPNFIARMKEELIGRCAFGLSLDLLPMSGDLYKNGIDTRFTKPILISLKQTNEAANRQFDTRFTQYVLLEYDYTIKISPNGAITKDF